MLPFGNKSNYFIYKGQLFPVVSPQPSPNIDTSQTLFFHPNWLKVIISTNLIEIFS